MIENLNELHFLLIMYDEFHQLKNRSPKRTWFSEIDETYNIEYADGFLFSAPEDLINILHEGAKNNVNPIIIKPEFKYGLN